MARRVIVDEGDLETYRPRTFLAQNGLRAAHAAGVTTVVTVTEYTRFQDLGPAALVVDHLGESNLPFRLLPSNANYNGARDVLGDATMFDLALGERLMAA